MWKRRLKAGFFSLTTLKIEWLAMATLFDYICILWWDSVSISLFKLDNENRPTTRELSEIILGFKDENLHAKGTVPLTRATHPHDDGYWRKKPKKNIIIKINFFMDFIKKNMKSFLLFGSFERRRLNQGRGHVLDWESQCKHLPGDFTIKVMTVAEFTKFLNSLGNCKHDCPFRWTACVIAIPSNDEFAIIQQCATSSSVSSICCHFSDFLVVHQFFLFQLGLSQRF